MRGHNWLLVAIAVACGWPVVPAYANTDVDSTVTHSKFIDPEDGWVDVSAFLDTGHGFIPIAAPITEPAVGYGGAGGLVFIRRNPPLPNGHYRRPNMTMVGGLGTENGTWAAFAGHSGSWRNDALQTLVGGIYGSVELDWFGFGDSPLNDRPAHYQLEPAGGFAQGRYRIGESRVQVGLAYGLASFDVSFDGDAQPVEISNDDLESRIGGIIPALIYDSRDNAFTPTSGLYGEVDAALFGEVLGGTSNFQRLIAAAMVYRPLGSRVFAGVRGDAAFSFGEAPFYTRPYIALRGVPVMRYVGENAASVELEARWQFWRRISVIGFTGYGSAWSDFAGIDSDQSVTTGGGGLRYELARRYGLHMGVDIAWGPDETAWYIQFGSAWFRP